MATLDDKLMGEKLHYYCSSSEDEDDGGPKFVADPGDDSVGRGAGGAVSTRANTGPKGVIEDWRRFKQLEKENRAEQAREKAELAKKLSMTCRSEREEAEAKAKEEREDQELEELLNDDFLASYMEKRMREMMLTAAGNQSKRFGSVLHLRDSGEFLDAVDKESKDVVVVMYLHEDGAAGCEAMRHCLKTVAANHPEVKFCQILSSSAGLSKHFESSGVPALLVYKSGELVGSFVRLTDSLGEDFFSSDVESFLIEHAVLQDKELTPSIIKGPQQHRGDDSDSD